MIKFVKKLLHFVLILSFLLGCFPLSPINAEAGSKIDMLSKNSMTVYLGKSIYGVCDYLSDELEDAAFIIYTDTESFFISKITQVKTSNSSVASVKLIEGGRKIRVTPSGEGTATITVCAYGCDEDDEAKNFYDTIKINVKRIGASKLTISSIPDQKYTGKRLEPSVKVKYGAKTLKKDTDYRLSYFDNRKVGKATAVIKFIGNYTGTKNKTFNIVPTISKTSANMYTATKLTLSVKSSEKVKWKSSNEKIATVNQSGTVTAHKKGKATIKATTGEKTLTCKINVLSRKLNKTELKLYTGQTATLTYTGGSGTIKWKSSNTKVATVNSKGKVTAKSTGNALITATRNGEALLCKVRVLSRRKK